VLPDMDQRWLSRAADWRRRRKRSCRGLALPASDCAPQPTTNNAKTQLSAGLSINPFRSRDLMRGRPAESEPHLSYSS
jgi:hypothetical protein